MATTTFALLRWIVIILYIVCFGSYILFTRQPDYFDGQFTTGKTIQDSGKLVVLFSDGVNNYRTPVKTFLHHPNEEVRVIYEAADPSNAQVYSLFDYWVSFGELIASLVIVGFLYWIATTVTNNPTAEAVVEELEMGKKKPRKPKYDS